MCIIGLNKWPNLGYVIYVGVRFDLFDTDSNKQKQFSQQINV